MKEPSEINLEQFKDGNNSNRTTASQTEEVTTEDVLTQYEKGPDPQPSNPDLIDVNFEDLIDTTGTGSDMSIEAVDGMSLDQLMKAVFRRGSIMFNDGRMLTKCSGYNCPAMCGMYPLPHPRTGDTVMVCTGPLLAYTPGGIFSSRSREALKPKHNCSFHPDRINEAPEYSSESVGMNKDWIQD